jgi:hypothetical protein
MDFDKNLKTLTETRLGDNLPLIPDGRKENIGTILPFFLMKNIDCFFVDVFKIAKI